MARNQHSVLSQLLDCPDFCSWVRAERARNEVGNGVV